MTIEKWLSDVYYDEWGTHIWNKVDEDGGSQLIADVRGWGAIQNEFKTNEEAEQFQDEVGKFIVEAIKEKIARTSKSKNNMNKLEKLFGILQEMENTKLERPTISEITDNNEVKMDLLTMNLLFDQISKISELKDLINKYGSSIVISTMPICKYKGQTFIMKYEFSKESIISLIENGEKVIIYNGIDGAESNKLPYGYRGAIITSDGNVNDPYPIKAIPEYTMEELTDKLGHNFKIKK